MKKDFTILIADRNRHVREFLQREMTSAGYRVLLAENAREVIKQTFHHDPLDLIVVDPDLPDSEDSGMLDDILDRIPALPVIVHTYRSEYGISPKNMNNVVFVEKGGGSVEHLKRVVYETLVERPSRRQ
ncbi:MAG: response regulator [Deltaproteobacteria bacterium]|nr:response regulator [Deltaproteobacteria bacterium]